MTDYYHQQITQKSWDVLIDLKRQCNFMLIGGWAVYLYTHALKSKDIDIVVSLTELERLKETLSLTKNERLKKYHAVKDEIDIDVYAEFFSNPGLPAEEVLKHKKTVEGFTIPELEVLLILKQHAYQERIGSPKGEKDALDIIAILKAGVNFPRYCALLDQCQKQQLAEMLVSLLRRTKNAPELSLNEHQLSRLKKQWLAQLK